MNNCMDGAYPVVDSCIYSEFPLRRVPLFIEGHILLGVIRCDMHFLFSQLPKKGEPFFCGKNGEVNIPAIYG